MSLQILLIRTSPSSVSRLSRKFKIIDMSQPLYRPPRPVTETDYLWVMEYSAMFPIFWCFQASFERAVTKYLMDWRTYLLCIWYRCFIEYVQSLKWSNFFYNPSLFAICTKYNKQMGGNGNKRGGRELSSAHPYVVGARPGMGQICPCVYETWKAGYHVCNCSLLDCALTQFTSQRDPMFDVVASFGVGNGKCCC
jgi:hypothetical protein